MSNTLPWRTLATPATPSDFSAPSIALPCGSRMPDFRVTVTRAFMLHSSCPASRRASMFFFAIYNKNAAGGNTLDGFFRASLRHGGHGGRLLQHTAIAGNLAGFAHQAEPRPERRLGRGDHRQAAALLDRLGAVESAQSAAGDQHAIGG